MSICNSIVVEMFVRTAVANAMTRNTITPSICYLGQMSVARQEAFDSFKRTYRHNQTIQEQKRALKEKYASKHY